MYRLEPAGKVQHDYESALKRRHTVITRPGKSELYDRATEATIHGKYITYMFVLPLKSSRLNFVFKVVSIALN